MCANHKRTGFTLIELLAAVALLAMITLLMGRIFGASSSLWRAGNKRIESNNSGRTGIEFMAREMSHMIVSSGGPTLVQDSDRDDYLGMKSDIITFVAMNHYAEWRSGNRYRDVQEIRYQVAAMPFKTNRFQLVRYVVEKYANSFNSYESPTDWMSDMDGQATNFASVLAENVRNFEVYITPVGATAPKSDYVYDATNPPSTIDIYLEVLAEDDAIKAAFMPNNDPFLNAATRRYATRVYVLNRDGYALP